MTSSDRSPTHPEPTPAEFSVTAARAGLNLSPDDAAAIANRIRVTRSMYDVIRSLDVSTIEPASIFVPSPGS